jgi:hypothetical protein
MEQHSDNSYVEMQGKLRAKQGSRRLHYCRYYCRYVSHEPEQLTTFCTATHRACLLNSRHPW